ncbi:MAG: hypothetical protein ACOX66_00655 [Oscillospiraceae bacterium]
MRALFIILLVLAVLALLPVGMDGGWATGQSVTLRVRIGFIKIGLLPKKKKEPKAKKPPKPKKAEETEAQNKKKKSGLAAMDTAGKLALVKEALRTLGRLRDKLRVQYLRFRFTVASPDPFKTAMGFGLSSSAASAFVPLLDEAFDIEERDIGPAFDFTTDKPRADVWITASILLWQLLYIAGAFGIAYLKIKKQYSSKPDKDRKAEKRKD